MKSLLQKLSILAIQLQDVEYSQEQLDNEWIGNTAATEADISALEKRLNITLPEDYIIFLKTTNGLSHSSYTEPLFTTTDKVTYLRDSDPELIDIWRETGNDDIIDHLESSICVSSVHDEQLFLLIPPSEQHDNWLYWKFAHWIPGEDPYDDLTDYFNSTINFIASELKQLD